MIDVVRLNLLLNIVLMNAKNMRKKLEKNTGMQPLKLPTIHVKFCYNRAVVSTEIHPEPPTNHIDVYFGLFFWFRLICAVIRNWINYK